MMAKVFISYRREDSAAYAGRIQDRLERDLLGAPLREFAHDSALEESGFEPLVPR
jgi:hypothetical protein